MGCWRDCARASSRLRWKKLFPAGSVREKHGSGGYLVAREGSGFRCPTIHVWLEGLEPLSQTEV